MRFITLLLFTLVACLAQPLDAQPGCTDPQATNFTSGATQNDGSCVYPVTTYTPATKTALAVVLNETSGLVMAKGALWTHNDSDDAPNIYQIDTLTNTIIQTVTLGGASVVDWEDIAFDGTYFYVGDFGNNANGNRTDLKVYKFPLSAIPSGENVSVPETAIEVIQFSYADQTDFLPQGSNNTRFDCEAMIVRDGQIHLFTKNWLENNTAHYVLPALAGTYQAEKQAAFFVDGLITGADITAAGVIVLAGYRLSSGECFMWLLYDYPDVAFFSGNKRRIELGSVLGVGQMEGICFRNNGQGYLSNERTLNLIPARLYSFSMTQWLPAVFLPTGRPVKKNDTLCRGLPNVLGADQLPVLAGYLPANTRLALWDTLGKNLWQGKREELPQLQLDTGMYYLQVFEPENGKGCAVTFWLN